MAKHKTLGATSMMALALGGAVLGLADVKAASPIEDLKDGDKVTISTLTEKCYNVTAGSAVEIDITDGGSIVCDGAHAIAVGKGANVTINGITTNGPGAQDVRIVSANSDGAAAIYNDGGTVIVKGGHYYSKKWYAVKNLGTMIIDDGYYTQGTSDESSYPLIINGGFTDAVSTSNNDGVARMTINNGYFYSTTEGSYFVADKYSDATINYAIFVKGHDSDYLMDVSGRVTINNGVFNSSYGEKSPSFVRLYAEKGDGISADYAPGEITINGGSIFANGSFVASTHSEAPNAGTLRINGGGFQAHSLMGDDRTILAPVTGGMYSSSRRAKDFRPEASQIADGYMLVSWVEPNTGSTTYQVLKGTVPEGVERIEIEMASISEDLAAAAPKLKAVYDVVAMGANDEEVPVKDQEITVTLKFDAYGLDESEKYFQIAYIKDGQLTEEIFNPEVRYVASEYAYYLTFTTKHLSQYGVLMSTVPFGGGNIGGGTGTTGGNAGGVAGDDTTAPDSGMLTSETVAEAKASNGVAVVVATILAAVVTLAGVLKIAKKHQAKASK